MEQNQKIQSTKDHCVHCFNTIIAALENRELPQYPSHLSKFSTPLFVTWHIKGDRLRGCIGTFSSSPIETTLGKYAQVSAFQDSRFKPISGKEVKDLNVSVSLLVNFTENKQPLDWNIGQHGIVIDFEVNGRSYGGTYLPEVMPEQGWTKEEALQSLIEKAGYRGKLNTVFDKIKLTTYESSKCQITYDEYVQIVSNKK